MHDRHDRRGRRGQLKIFFGASAGVGKSYTIHQSARAARAAGIDVAPRQDRVRHPTRGSIQYLPLKTGRHALGVLAIEPAVRRRILLPEQHHLLETFAAQIALARERDDATNHLIVPPFEVLLAVNRSASQARRRP